MGSVEHKPLELWAIVTSDSSGEQTVIGTFTDIESAREVFFETINAPRLWSDDTFYYALIPMVEDTDYPEESGFDE